MSWLSKLVGGKTLKLAAIATAAYAGSQYVWGTKGLNIPASGTGGNPFGYGSTPTYAGAGEYGSTFATRMFNKAGLTPFSDTAVGSFLSPVTDLLRPESMGGSGVLSRVLGSVSTGDMERPTPGTIQPTSVRLDSNFQAGRVNQLPVGKSGSIEAAIGSEAMRQYMARQVAMMGLPRASSLPSASSVSSSALSQTTSAKRRAYKGLTS